MYNVLNTEWERIVVETINTQIHKHISGREFTEDDACVKKITIDNNIMNPNTLQEDLEEVKPTDADIEHRIMSREEAIETYKGIYGRRPSSQMKLKNIIAKIIESDTKS